MKQIKLGKYGYRQGIAIIDDDDYIEVNKYHWHDNGRGYAKATFIDDEGRHLKIFMHQMVMNYPGTSIHHINGNKLDNRKANLMIVKNNGEHHTVKCPHCGRKFIA